MSSSGSRGPPTNRYSDRGEYDYNKQRRKNFYSGSSRRGGPGSSSLTRSKLPSKATDGSMGPTETHYSSAGRARYGGSSGPNSLSRSFGPNVRDNRGSYGSYGSSKGAYSSYNQNSGSYYSGYGNYGNFGGKSGDYSSTNSSNFYNSRGDNWRGERTGSSGDSRLTSSKSLSLSASSYNGRLSNGAISNPKSLSATSTGEYRKDRYGPYNQTEPSGSKWKSNYNSGKPTLNSRNSFPSSAGSRSFSAKDRMKGSLSGSSSLVNTGKRGDTYYPSRSSYSANNSSQTFNKSQVDRYSSKVKSSPQSDYYKNRNLSGEDEDNAYNKRTYSDHYSPSPSNDYEQADDTKESEDDYEPDISHHNIAKEIHDEMQNDNHAGENDNEDDEEDDEDEDMETETRENLIERDNNLKYADEQNDENDVKIETEVINPQVNVTPIAKVDLSNEICYPDGCEFPVDRLESDFKNLQAEFEKFSKTDGNYLKYSLAKPIDNLHDYPFFTNNLKLFTRKREKLTINLSHNKRLIQRKKLSLWKDYSRGLDEWELQREKMDQQLKLIHPADDEMKKELDAIDVRIKEDFNIEPTSAKDIPPPPSSNNRRNRRHGDLVTTEAEFQEILQSLGKEQEEDPMIRAQKVSASIPDFILDPIERNVVKFMDSNNIVDDKLQWTTRVKTDFHNNFSTQEHALFCEGFCMFPKRFGAISRHMGGLRTAEDCVVHYYMTKKEVNYKQLVLTFKKKANRKNNRRGKISKSRNVSQNGTPISTPTTETAIENGVLESYNNTPTSTENSTEYYGEEVFTETGRRKRTTAPSFEGNVSEKKKTDSPTEVKTSDSSISLQKKKARKQKKEDTPTTAVNEIVEANADIVPVSVPIPDSNDIELEAKGSEFENIQNSEQNDLESKERRKTISSYWSITEANMFPSLLKEHGTKWTTIADKLTTKSATMVRNYFQRNAERHGWNEVAEKADERLQAKFAAVLNTPSEQNAAQDSIAEKYPIHPSQPPVISTSITPTAAQSAYIPIGTFQHVQSTPQNHSSPSPSLLPPSLGAPTSSINNTPIYSNGSNDSNAYENHGHVLNNSEIKKEMNDKPQHPSAIAAMVTKPVLPHSQLPRSSIMSLLNSDSSPVKPEPPRAVNDLKSLLNSPSSNSLPSLNKYTTPPSGNGLNALLSATTSSNPDGNDDKDKKQ
ncbi:DEHA2G09900p [Debaryomyces hansenii CBS767]|uniref:DEHA2G09900p n=1 Tax=Debaryomyces hansenii (strain ATCC 36239 / CBS 767 / BCRC 21394 / JCM 1990 / NBRC 0083 / IGC 2968) TaxID=284592 RepID=Q6BIJ4_DEBHA|nr:DEHA2G09900p [Debaryomyces hansenii CBS767]CAG90447.2 DEHA2G09900p [Debaryomyces hansenii CBS767]|eukprot:XP_461977.2 DEHA2G09900p [Debaryomyces hansenii CBS767]